MKSKCKRFKRKLYGNGEMASRTDSKPGLLQGILKLAFSRTIDTACSSWGLWFDPCRLSHLLHWRLGHDVIMLLHQHHYCLLRPIDGSSANTSKMQNLWNVHSTKAYNKSPCTKPFMPTSGSHVRTSAQQQHSGNRHPKRGNIARLTSTRRSPYWGWSTVSKPSRAIN